MVIAVEGMDGVGKTSIAKHISEHHDFKFIEKPLHYFYNDGAEKEYEDLMTVANRMYDVGDNIIKSWYFSLGDIYAARKFKDENIVLDRHFVSNYYWNGDLECEPIFNTLIQMAGVPDLTILLYAAPKTRMERLRKRNPEDPDLIDPDKMDDGYEKMFYFIEKFRLPYLVIDTDNRSLDEVKQVVDFEIQKLIEKHTKNQKKVLMPNNQRSDNYGNTKSC